MIKSDSLQRILHRTIHTFGMFFRATATYELRKVLSVKDLCCYWQSGEYEFYYRRRRIVVEHKQPFQVDIPESLLTAE